MVSEFFLPFDHFNLSSLPKDKKKEVIKKAKITITKIIMLFEYRKANKEYWDGPKLH